MNRRKFINTVSTCTAVALVPGGNTLASIFETKKSGLRVLSSAEQLVTPLIPKDSFDLDYSTDEIGPFGNKCKFVAHVNDSPNSLWQLSKLDIKTGRMILHEFKEPSRNIDPHTIKIIKVSMFNDNGTTFDVFNVLVKGPKVTRVMDESGIAYVLIEFDECLKWNCI